MYERLRPTLFRLDAERAHDLGTLAARIGQRVAGGYLTRQYLFESHRLELNVWGIDFRNPLGIAAGFDKNARLIRFWHQVGCGFAEVGSVTAKRSKGNPRPRAFRLPDDAALVNRMGLNNQGAGPIARRISRAKPFPLPVAVSLAKTHDPSIQGDAAIADFLASYRACAPHASVLVLNLSCPNTAEGKTFEDPNVLDDLLSAVGTERSAGHPPLLLKLSPPLTNRVVLDSAVDEIVAVGQAHGVDGYVASNTDSGRSGLKSVASVIDRVGPGGLSGAPLRSRSTELVGYLYRKTYGKVPILGVGGVASGADAYEKIRAGATLVQLYTALVYEGPALFQRTKQELVGLLERDGFGTVGEAVGVDCERVLA